MAIDFLAGAGADDVGGFEAEFFGFDADGEVVFAFDVFLAESGFDEAFAFAASERVAGEGKGDPENGGDLASDVAGIGVVGVDEIGHAFFAAQPCEGAIDEGIEVAPDNFFAQVAARAGFDAVDGGTVSEVFVDAGVVVADFGVEHAAGDQCGSRDAFIAGEGLDEFEDVEALATGVGIASEFEVFAADEPVE